MTVRLCFSDFLPFCLLGKTKIRAPFFFLPPPPAFNSRIISVKRKEVDSLEVPAPSPHFFSSFLFVVRVVAVGGGGSCVNPRQTVERKETHGSSAHLPPLTSVPYHMDERGPIGAALSERWLLYTKIEEEGGEQRKKKD